MKEPFNEFSFKNRNGEKCPQEKRNQENKGALDTVDGGKSGNTEDQGVEEE
jgi:hypothetical protein